MPDHPRPRHPTGPDIPVTNQSDRAATRGTAAVLRAAGILTKTVLKVNEGANVGETDRWWGSAFFRECPFIERTECLSSTSPFDTQAPPSCACSEPLPELWQRASRLHGLS